MDICNRNMHFSFTIKYLHEKIYCRFECFFQTFDSSIFGGATSSQNASNLGFGASNQHIPSQGFGGPNQHTSPQGFGSSTQHASPQRFGASTQHASPHGFGAQSFHPPPFGGEASQGFSMSAEPTPFDNTFDVSSLGMGSPPANMSRRAETEPGDSLTAAADHTSTVHSHTHAHPTPQADKGAGDHHSKADKHYLTDSSPVYVNEEGEVVTDLAYQVPLDQYMENGQEDELPPVNSGDFIGGGRSYIVLWPSYKFTASRARFMAYILN